MLTTEQIHPTAVIDESAEIGPDATIGAYSVIGPNVRIGAGTTIGPHVHIVRDTTIGRDCAVHHAAALGGDPQDLKYGGEPTHLTIGDRTVIREFVTMSRGTAAHGRTEVGSDCLFMAYSHVAHDCVIGDHVILANSVQMGGHVSIGDWVIVGGLTAIHQFAKIGAHAMVGGSAAVRKDVAPYVKASGNPLKLYGLNSIGLERRGFSAETRAQLKQVYRLFFQSPNNISQALAKARSELPQTPELMAFLTFVAGSERGLTV